MRLTLRTLLAYLDNTLEDKESFETLRGKIAVSPFASQLVQRIKATLVSPALDSPSPDAVGPVEDANAIGEYLDSTLSVEPVAEIERACLESEPLLGEVAACHQILTLVLGKPAAVSPSLRDRIYELPNSDAAKTIANRLTADSFASLSIPDESSGFGHDSAAEVPVSASMVTAPRKQPMSPVGPSDSGVSDAPKRLRAAGMADEHADERRSTGAGPRPRSSRLSELYAGSVRTSRITPWLVSLALAGVLLFALSRIFEPLLNQRLTEVESDGIEFIDTVPSDANEPISASQLSENSPSPRSEIVVPAESSPPMSPVGEPVIGAKETSDAVDTVNSSTLPAPVDSSGAVIAASKEEMEPVGAQPQPSAVAAPTATVAAAPLSASTASTAATAATSEPTGSPAAAPLATVTPPRAAEAMPPSSAGLAAPLSTEEKTAEPLDPAVPVAAEGEVAKLITDRTLVTTRPRGSDWRLVPSGGSIALNSEIVCAPTFRAKMETIDGVNVTMSGPTQLGFGRDDKGLTLYLANGRVLLRHKTPGAVLQLSLSGRPISIKFGSADTIVAIQLKHLRKPGADPLLALSHARVATLMIVQGTAELTSSNMTNQLDTGQQWEFVGNGDPEQTVAKEIAEWIDEPDPNETSLEALARSGLLSMLDEKQPLELSLREAIPFRRAEVGALASRTLLWIGRGDVYFGGDGILNQPRQKAYWDDHYRSLMTVVDQSALSADELYVAIGRMEAADRDRIFELLVGYSQEQLQGGADAKLVTLLDSPSMAVRVLALQNLRQITGTTLNYRADQDNAIRRATDVKKWEARARKGDIRWPAVVDEAD